MAGKYMAPERVVSGEDTKEVDVAVTNLTEALNKFETARPEFMAMSMRITRDLNGKIIDIHILCSLA